MREDGLRAGVFVTSCWRDRPKQQAIRDTWGAALSPTFFLGMTGEPDDVKVLDPDEYRLIVRDGYKFVPWKTWFQCKWAVLEGLDYVFICDVDTYVDPARLSSYPLEHDYTGHRCDEGHAAGGNGYWLSKRALRLVATGNPLVGYADLWVGRTLASSGISVHHDPAYGDGTITRHLSVDGHYDPELMYEEHIKRYPRDKRENR